MFFSYIEYNRTSTHQNTWYNCSKSYFWIQRTSKYIIFYHKVGFEYLIKKSISSAPYAQEKIKKEKRYFFINIIFQINSQKEYHLKRYITAILHHFCLFSPFKESCYFVLTLKFRRVSWVLILYIFNVLINHFSKNQCMVRLVSFEKVQFSRQTVTTMDLDHRKVCVRGSVLYLFKFLRNIRKCYGELARYGFKHNTSNLPDIREESLGRLWWQQKQNFCFLFRIWKW